MSPTPASDRLILRSSISSIIISLSTSSAASAAACGQQAPQGVLLGQGRGARTSPGGCLRRIAGAVAVASDSANSAEEEAFSEGEGGGAWAIILVCASSTA